MVKLIGIRANEMAESETQSENEVCRRRKSRKGEWKMGKGLVLVVRQLKASPLSPFRFQALGEPW